MEVTLRDVFAVSCLEALLRALCATTGIERLREVEEWSSLVGAAAYELADACLVARRVPSPPHSPDILDALNTPIRELGLPVRAEGVIARFGVSRAGELTNLTAEALRNERNCGDTTVFQVREALRKIGLALRGDSP